MRRWFTEHLSNCHYHKGLFQWHWACSLWQLGNFPRAVLRLIRALLNICTSSLSSCGSHLYVYLSSLTDCGHDCWPSVTSNMQWEKTLYHCIRTTNLNVSIQANRFCSLQIGIDGQKNLLSTIVKKWFSVCLLKHTELGLEQF